jgi:murein L,D-transpeptidase YafK
LPETTTADGKVIEKTTDGDWIKKITARYDSTHHRTDIRVALSAGYVYQAFQDNDKISGRFELGVSAFQTAPGQGNGVVQQVRSRLMSWRDAWQSKQLDTYMAHYHPGFISDGFNRWTWKRHKAKLNGKYRSIKVELSDIRITIDGNQAVAYFKQNYRSDVYQDVSNKELVFHKHEGVWKIYCERQLPK